MGIVRLLLALSVVAAHSGSNTFVGGKIAVQSFYIISGFYMSLIINEKYIGANNSYRLFITNRLIRIFPVYWIVLLITVLACICISIVSNGHSFPIFEHYLSVKSNVWSLTYLILTNLVIFGQAAVLFLGISSESGNLFFTSNFWNTSPLLYKFLFVPQAWTLALELSFYLIAPFILKRGLKIVITLIILSLLLRFILFNFYLLQNDPWTARFFPTEIMFFLSGYLSYRIYILLKNKSVSNYFYLFMLAFTLVFITLYKYFPSINISWCSFPMKEMIYFTTIILSVPFLFNFLKNNKIDNKIGELSYPVYISHMLIITICGAISSQASLFDFLKKDWVIGIITIVFAIILNKTVVSPIERYRQSRLKT
ncbi:MAG: acyltransferase [Saprospiraceae bacterium]